MRSAIGTTAVADGDSSHIKPRIRFVVCLTSDFLYDSITQFHHQPSAFFLHLSATSTNVLVLPLSEEDSIPSPLSLRVFHSRSRSKYHYK
jgi:hypothetical protein